MQKLYMYTAGFFKWIVFLYQNAFCNIPFLYNFNSMTINSNREFNQFVESTNFDHDKEWLIKCKILMKTLYSFWQTLTLQPIIVWIETNKFQT